jgi:hypothetical protein
MPRFYPLYWEQFNLFAFGYNPGRQLTRRHV